MVIVSLQRVDVSRFEYSNPDVVANLPALARSETNGTCPKYTSATETTQPPIVLSFHPYRDLLSNKKSQVSGLG